MMRRWPDAGRPAILCSSRVGLRLDSGAWENIQDVVRSFRRALGRGERPAIEAYAPERAAHRIPVMLELIHEEMEFQIKAGAAAGSVVVPQALPEIAQDPRRASELVAADSTLRRRMRGDCVGMLDSSG